MGDSLQGRCQCGALYVSDSTGYNVGNAMVECLVAACNDNWDLAWDLVPGDDYLTGRVEDYDEQSHQVIEAGNLDGRAVHGVLYFIRLHGAGFKNMADNSLKKKESSQTPLEPEPDPLRPKRRVSKMAVQRLVEARSEEHTELQSH